MCGFAGVVFHDLQFAQDKILWDMIDVISHRGPDGEGVYTYKNVGFGHKKLAINDLTEKSNQPMISDCGRFTLVYNGEVYNFQEIRHTLTNKGYTFKSNGDTEVVLCALMHWGIKAVELFNGMFALAFFDKSEEKIYLARDRYGIKPLYYTQLNHAFLFGSEIKSFLSFPGFKADMNCPGLMEYFTFQNMFTDQTLFKSVYMLPPGHWACLKTGQKGILEQNQYWDFDFSEPDNSVSENECIEQLDELFFKAVNRQLVSDVEIGSYLSGGMDSGSIAGIASQKVPHLKTFTCGFDMSSANSIEMLFDERDKAEKMASHFGTEHYEIMLRGGDMERIMSSLVWHLEDLRVGQCYPNAYVAKLASKFVKVVLSGAGGDEIFAGYPWRYYRGATAENFDDFIDKYYHFWQRLIPNRYLRRAFAPIAEETKDVWTRNIFKDLFSHKTHVPQQPEEFINYSLYFEAKTFLPGLLLVEDKLSMANSLETRIPFLDNDLVDFGTKVPVKYKLRNLKEVLKFNENEAGRKSSVYFRKSNDGKIILRKMMAKYIPKAVIEREKQGFSGPDGSWFRNESLELVQDTICNKNAIIYNYLDFQTMHKLIKEHLSGEENRRLLIWSLLSVEFWCQNFLKNER